MSSGTYFRRRIKVINRNLMSKRTTECPKTRDNVKLSLHFFMFQITEFDPKNSRDRFYALSIGAEKRRGPYRTMAQVKVMYFMGY